MSELRFPVFDFAPLGGHGAAGASVTIRLARTARRDITMRTNAVAARMGGAVVASDLIPGIAREHQIRLTPDSEYVVEWSGRQFHLYALRDEMAANDNRLYLTFDADAPPPFDAPLALVRASRAA